MRWLLFISRVAFICNLFFIACIVLRYSDPAISSDFKGLIIIIGYPMSIFFNWLVNIIVIAMTLVRRSVNVPRWLILFNFFCFSIQITYLLFF